MNNSNDAFDLDELNNTASNIIHLLNSRRTGRIASSPTNDLPEINLNHQDIENIFQQLHNRGSLVQQIIRDARATYSHHQVHDETQELVDNHATALSTIITIQQNQMDPADYGLMLQAAIGFQNSILNLRQVLITLSSYRPEPLAQQSSSKTQTGDINWSKVGAVIGIIGIVVAVGGYFLYSSSIEQNAGDIDIDSSSQIIANSGFGSIVVTNSTFNFKDETKPVEGNALFYRNETLGFEIARPNLKWYFETDLTNLKQERTGTLPDDEFIGGIYIGTDSDENVFVAVHDITGLNKDSLEGYVDAEIDWVLRSFDAKLKVKEMSPNKRWALFGIETYFPDKVIYGEQILEIRGDRLYMLQYTGALPEQMGPEKREELRTIIDSFKPFP